MNDKVKRKLDRILTVVTVVSIIICLSLCIQVIQGKSAGLFGFRIFHILTGSMEPTIPTNSNVIVREVDIDSLEVGDIITFISRDEAIFGNANTHRIVAIVVDDNGEKCFATRGDANNATDSLLVYPEDIVGKVVFHMNPSISLFLGFLHTKFGFVTVIVIPLLIIIWLLTKDFKKGVKEYLNESPEQATVPEATASMNAAGTETAVPMAASAVPGANAQPGTNAQMSLTPEFIKFMMVVNPEVMTPEMMTFIAIQNPELKDFLEELMANVNSKNA